MSNEAKRAADEATKHMQLVDALRTNNMLQITYLIRNLLLDSKSNPAYGSPLHLAVALSSRDVIERILILFCGANHPPGEAATPKDAESIAFNWINSQNSDGDTPVHIAAKLGRLDSVEMLFKCPLIDETTRNYQSLTAEDIAKDDKVVLFLRGEIHLIFTIILIIRAKEYLL